MYQDVDKTVSAYQWPQLFGLYCFEYTFVQHWGTQVHYATFFLVYECLCVFSWQLWFSSHRICCYFRWWKCVIYKRCGPSAAKLCLTLCNSMDCSTPAFPILHYLPEFAQTPVHQVGDAIQTSHPLLPHRRWKGVINIGEKKRKEKQNYLGTRNNMNT